MIQYFLKSQRILNVSLYQQVCRLQLMRKLFYFLVKVSCICNKTSKKDQIILFNWKVTFSSFFYRSHLAANPLGTKKMWLLPTFLRPAKLLNCSFCRRFGFSKRLQCEFYIPFYFRNRDCQWTRKVLIKRS